MRLKKYDTIIIEEVNILTVEELIEELKKVEGHKEVTVFIKSNSAKITGVIDSHLNVILNTK